MSGGGECQEEKSKGIKKSNGGVSLVQEAKEGWSYKMPFERDLEEIRASCRVGEGEDPGPAYCTFRGSAEYLWVFEAE